MMLLHGLNDASALATWAGKVGTFDLYSWTKPGSAGGTWWIHETILAPLVSEVEWNGVKLPPMPFGITMPPDYYIRMGQFRRTGRTHAAFGADGALTHDEPPAGPSPTIPGTPATLPISPPLRPPPAAPGLLDKWKALSDGTKLAILGGAGVLVLFMLRGS